MIEICTGMAIDSSRASAICGTYKLADDRKILVERADGSREWIAAVDLKIKDQLIMGNSHNQLNSVVSVKKTKETA